MAGTLTPLAPTLAYDSPVEPGQVWVSKGYIRKVVAVGQRKGKERVQYLVLESPQHCPGEYETDLTTFERFAGYRQVQLGKVWKKHRQRDSAFANRWGRATFINTLGKRWHAARTNNLGIRWIAARKLGKKHGKGKA